MATAKAFTTRESMAVASSCSIGRAFIVAWLGLALGGHALAQADALYARLAPSVWSIGTFDGNGQPLLQASAVVIGPGRLITACGALRQASEVLVMRENVSYGATLEYPDIERNLCQLRVANFKAPAVTLGDPLSLRVGVRVYALGSPRGMETTFSDGMLSALRRDDDGQLRMLQTSAPVSAGSGGGGLFDAQGRLIGIMSGIERDAQNLNFAIPVSLLAELPTRGQRALDQWQGKTMSMPTSAAPLDVAAESVKR